jgi:hypothetical protein
MQLENRTRPSTTILRLLVSKIVAIKLDHVLSDTATECEAHLTLLHRQKKALPDGASDILQRVGT